ncbi:glycosyltransferase family 39 protein [Sphingomonas sp.]|uniref:glycosyltransferase family 39 protein n=1 Tax=Sphingomonas sp. TaxID=28214 RepID=UPI002CC9FDA3|nr:glycosyltransferase family 39 protein [Sphingomonas sp.]HWK36678.1 glycosyltransferase family 39 protein [Sphingomonas sp.]
MTPPLRPRETLVLAGVLLGAAVLRIASANYGLWFDELASLTFANQPIGHLWGAWMVRETNPPLYYTLLKGWVALAGDGDRAVRSLSVAIGLCGIVAGWALARRLGGRAAGLLAAALIALSAAHVDLSQEARAYVLAHTAVLVAALGMVRYLETRARGALLLYAGAAIVALYAHTMLVVFALLANLTMLWLLRRDRPALRGWIAANLAVAIGWAWWGWITLRQLGGGSANIGWIARPDGAAAWRMTADAYAYGFVPDGGVAGGAALALLLAAIVALAWRDRRPGVTLLAVLTIGAPPLLFAISQWVPVFLPRTLSWASGPVAVLLALAVVAIPSRAVAIALGAVLLVVEGIGVARWLPARQEEGWREAVALVAQRDPRALLLVQGDAAALAAAHYRDLAAPGLAIVVLDPDPADGDRWGDGLARLTHVDVAGARALLHGDRPLYALRRGSSDPARALAGEGVAETVAVDRQPFVDRWRLRPVSGHRGDGVEAKPE